MTDNTTSITKNLTDVEEFLEELYGGVFKEKLARALSDTALSVVAHGRAGEVSLTFSLKQIGESPQVNVGHKLKFTKPTTRGKVTEEDDTSTPMHVGRGGRMSIFQEDQGQLFDKQGKPKDETA
jgi:hypothetical protein